MEDMLADPMTEFRLKANVERLCKSMSQVQNIVHYNLQSSLVTRRVWSPFNKLLHLDHSCFLKELTMAWEIAGVGAFAMESDRNELGSLSASEICYGRSLELCLDETEAAISSADFTCSEISEKRGQNLH